MIRLMVLQDTRSGAAPIAVFGGVPVAPEGTRLEWPRCQFCNEAMQFLGRIAIPGPGSNAGQVMLLFMCQNDPGMCEEWDAQAGGNAAMIVPAQNLTPVTPPPDGVTKLSTEYAAVTVDTDFESYGEAREGWSAASGRSPRHVLGQVLGEPSWLQADETPVCAGCGAPMRFIAQLEQGPVAATEMNFGGGGCAYVFDCARCEQSARFLWQC